ncbi:hypothetical protein [Agromyces italicus]|uniref:hypothetical protein n=1 Tax=Agromyces italicus TaxID=279572 RepID=UPI00146BEBD5|nr:hypothetical protein [Agromyces italicus]
MLVTEDLEAVVVGESVAMEPVRVWDLEFGQRGADDQHRNRKFCDDLVAAVDADRHGSGQRRREGLDDQIDPERSPLTDRGRDPAFGGRHQKVGVESGPSLKVSRFCSRRSGVLDGDQLD